MTPFQISFLGNNTFRNIEEWRVLFIIDRLVDFFFLVDILVQFRTAVRDPHTHELDFKSRVVARKYLKGWFIIDVLSTVVR